MDDDNKKTSLKSSSSQDIKSLKLQLGDIITIVSPDNEIFHNQTFIIDFINPSKIVVINTESLEKNVLQMNQEGSLLDATITGIDLIFRNKYPGFAKQNNLIPGKWIDIHFGGNIPISITGNITNLEEDMIEIKTYPQGETIYINFNYSGIPEDIPIEAIDIRDKPEKEKPPSKTENKIETDKDELTEKKALSDDEEEITKHDYTDPDFIEDVDDEDKEEEVILEMPKQQIEEQINQMILQADDIVFGMGEEFKPITQYVQKDIANVRYSIEAQCNDLLDEMLSSIPDSERTRSVLKNIHNMIERFKELRSTFSIYDKHKNVIGPLKKGYNWKPLTEQLMKFNHTLLWLLPVTKYVKKVYDIQGEIEDLPSDIVPLKVKDNLKQLQQEFDMYKSNNFPDEQSKYNYLVKFLYNEETPFLPVNPEELSKVIYSLDVGSNIDAVVNNLGSLYSSVVSNSNLTSKRFVIQRYNLGVKSIISSKLDKNSMTYKLNDVTQADTMSIGSIMTLPEPVKRFSRINLPTTSILEKSNLNTSYINYWQLLNTYTKMKTISVDEKKELFDSENPDYLKEITNYVMEKSNETMGMYTQEELYSNFVDQIIPKTEQLFEMSMKHLNGEISLVGAIKYMEPFLVYGNDLNDTQYNLMTEGISKQIARRIKLFVEKGHMFFKLKSIKSDLGLNPSAQSIYDAPGNLSKEVFTKGYNYSKMFPLTNSELLHRILSKDAGRLFNSSITLETLPLMFPDSIANLFENTSTSNKELLEEYAKQNDCKKYVLAKQYTSLDELEADNNRDIYFDKKFDTTQYSLLDDPEYQKEMATRDPEDFIEYLVKKLEKKEKLNTQEAYYLAETLVNGMKKVVEGDYAFIFDLNYGSNDEETSINYFERVNNMWKKDEKIDKSMFINDDSLLCNVQKDCITANKECESTNLNKTQIEQKTLKNILSEFDEKYVVSKDKMEGKVKATFEYNNDVIDKLSLIHLEDLYKYNNKHLAIGGTDYEPLNDSVSPYYDKLQLILGQADFVKKQHDIIRFAMQFTRKSLPHLDESDGWRYCIKTSIPLLPQFRYTMASAFINTPEMFLDTIEELKNTIGKISDDGNAWVDVNSGEVIVYDNFVFEDVYVDGFKEKSKELLEKDAADKVIGKLKSTKNESHEMKICNKIIDAFADKMGINMEEQKSFISSFSIQLFQSKIPNEKDYNIRLKEAKKNQKKMPSYNELYNTYLLYFTMATFLICVQTNIPSITTHRTFPGCISSFRGFPFDGAGDDSAINYMACVAYTMKNSFEPWKVLLKKKQESIAKSLKDTIQQNFIENTEIQRRMEEKAQYLLVSPLEEIPDSINVISAWSNFLPPLIPFKITNLHPLTREFKDKLLQDLKSGYAGQREDLLVVSSKIIFYSLALQQRIQKIVGQHAPLLKNVSSVPFVENACCDTIYNDSTTIQYFASKDREIVTFNSLVKGYTDILDDVHMITRAGLFYSPINTKNIYPLLKGEFSENTIYTAFVEYCRFNSILPIPDYLLKFCEEKPRYINSNDSVREIIIKLKNDGQVYTLESLLQLFQQVCRENIVNTSFSSPKPDYIDGIRGIIENLADNEDDSENEFNDKLIINDTFAKFMLEKMDTFDISESDEQTSRDFKNYLAKTNKELKENIVTFISSNISNELSTKSLKEMFDEVLEFDENTPIPAPFISDTNGYNFIDSYQTFFFNFLKIYPNIILNKVDYETTIVPSYWKLSNIHTLDIKNIVKKEVEELRVFYDKTTIRTLLEKVQDKGKILLDLAKTTPYYTKIMYQENETESVFDQRTSILLIQHYLLLIFDTYINLTDDKNCLFIETQTKQNFEDIFTIESLDDAQSYSDAGLQITEQELMLEGDKKKLKSVTSHLLYTFMKIMKKTNETIKMSYDVIMDKVFRLEEGEKRKFTQRLDSMTDEQRDVNVVMKINKLEEWGKGLKKGILAYDPEMYDEERETMLSIERDQKMLMKNPDVSEENIDQFMAELETQKVSDQLIDDEAYDMSHMNDDYDDGHYGGDELEDQEMYY